MVENGGGVMENGGGVMENGGGVMEMVVMWWRVMVWCRCWWYGVG